MIEDLSVSRRKFFASLRQPRHRREAALFAAEGEKCIFELADSFPLRYAVATSAWFDSNNGRLQECCGDAVTLYKASRADMERISALATPPEVIAYFDIPDREIDLDAIRGELVVALDGVQDPGNLGTIIRACDWFGVKHLLCSANTVDMYNSKVVQATMGAIGRVSVHYADLPLLLAGLKDMPVYGTFLEGDDIYRAELTPTGVIVMGNEGRGISGEVAGFVSRKLFIPPYPADGGHVESLNVSMATAITLSQFRGKMSE